MKRCAVFNWSGGKDSALALFKCLNHTEMRVEKLLTNLSDEINRSTSHGIRKKLMQKQAECLGLPIDFLSLPESATFNNYERIFAEKYQALKEEGFTDAVFGDILLGDLKQYRENQLKPLGFEAHFPIWGRNTGEIAGEFLRLGFKAVVVSVSDRILGESFVGVPFDEAFLNRLPESCDPCGENGEFHTFVYDGPIFKTPVPFETGEKIYREYDNPSVSEESDPDKIGFWFCDLVMS